MSFEMSPRKRTELANRRSRQEKRWERRSSEVTVTVLSRCACGEWATDTHVCRQ